MGVIGIDHIQLAIPKGGEARARPFYTDVLGLSEVPKPEALKGRGGLWFTAGGINIHLGVDGDFHPAQKAHPALVVTGLADYAARARAAGCRIVDDDPLPGFDRIFLNDPFGNRIELMEKRG